MTRRAAAAALGLAALLLAAEAQAQPRRSDTAGQMLNGEIANGRYAEDPAAIVDGLIRVLDRSPQLVDAIESAALWGLLAGLAMADDADAEVRLISTLLERGWTPADSIRPPPDLLYVRLAMRYVERGELDAARAALDEVWTSGGVIDVLIDRRFEPLWAELETAGWSDVRAAAEREVAAAVALREAHPRSLEAITTHMETLRRVNRAAEAVAIGQEARAAIVSGRRDDYDDAPYFANWALNELADALADVGDFDQARVVMRAAAIQEEQGQSQNVSQLLNSASDLVSDGRHAEALRRASLIGPDDVSTYGWAVTLAIRVCASAALGDSASVEENLAQLRPLRDEGGYAPLVDALTCAERLDEAAEVTVWTLETPWTRLDALFSLQDFIDPPRDRKPYEVEIDARANAVDEHPEVRAAAERVGRILSWDILR